MARVALHCLFVWLGLHVSGWGMGTAYAQETSRCGNLDFRSSPDTGRVISSAGTWFLFQVFRRTNGDEVPVLPGTPWGGIPKASCLEGSVLTFAYFSMSGEPIVSLVFQNGDYLSGFLSLDAYKVQGDAIILPARPRLDEELRERIPAQFRSLFDYAPLKGKFG